MARNARLVEPGTPFHPVRRCSATREVPAENKIGTSMTVEPTANGNTGTAARYDIENRPTCSTPPDNKRIWEGAAYTTETDTFSEDRFTLYGLDGQRVGIYRIRNRMSPPDTINMRFVTMEENVWVGKRLLKTRKGTTTEVVLQDRLGSVLFRYNANTDAKKAYAY